MKKTKDKLNPNYEITWCPGCPNFLILEASKQALTNLIDKSNYKQTDFCIVTGIGCHAKIYDYINTSGIYGLHGRVIPTSLGITLGNPKLKVIGFAGDGDTYAEGMAHFIHAGRYNTDMTLIVHDNQAFSLTTGQPTPTSQQGYITKSTPYGEPDNPLNPLKLALASGITFIARCNSKEISHTTEIIEKAIKHPWFSYVEIMQDCLIFNKSVNNKDKLMYKVNNKDKKKAEKLAEEYNYQEKKGKIPIGIIYQEKNPTLNEKLKKWKKRQKK